MPCVQAEASAAAKKKTKAGAALRTTNMDTQYRSKPPRLKRLREPTHGAREILPEIGKSGPERPSRWRLRLEACAELLNHSARWSTIPHADG